MFGMNSLGVLKKVLARLVPAIQMWIESEPNELTVFLTPEERKALSVDMQSLSMELSKEAGVPAPKALTEK